VIVIIFSEVMKKAVGRLDKSSCDNNNSTQIFLIKNK